MILTYKIRHGGDFTEELKKAKKVAEFALERKSVSSKDGSRVGFLEGGLGRNRNPDSCDVGGPGQGSGEERGAGKNRRDRRGSD